MEPGGAQTGRTYKIGQAAKLLDVKPFVLRFWEGEFREVLVPVRTPSGQRAYTEGNLDTVRRIKRLLYEEGLTIEGAKKRLLAEPRGQAPQPPPPAAQAQIPIPAPVLSAGLLKPPAPAPDKGPDKALLRELAGELSALLRLLSRP